MNRERTAAAICLTIVGAFAAPAHAGDRLQIPQLVARSQAAVILDVHLGSDTAADKIEIRQVLGGPVQATTVPPPEWLNECVPARKSLKRWVALRRGWQARKLWQKALAAGRFEALVFLQTINGQLRASCELESMLMKHTSVHPNYSAYVDEVKAAWAKRAP
jgi:hypothetical protein